MKKQMQVPKIETEDKGWITIGIFLGDNGGKERREKKEVGVNLKWIS